MKSIQFAFLVASALSGLGLSVGAAGCSSDDNNDNGGGGQGATYHAELAGNQETPAVATTATGTADFTLSADKKTLSYHVKHNVANATVAHIHLGSALEAGNIAYELSPVSPDMSGTITFTGANDVANLDAAKFYVNVHSQLHGGGEIRGQLLHPGETLYVANLTGAQETPPIASPGVGTSAIILDAAKENITFHVKTSLTPSASHIHTGIATQAGPITIDFKPTSSLIDGTSAISKAQVTDLTEGRMYVNVHTTANPKGEIRGQLLLPGETLYSAEMKPSNEVVVAPNPDPSKTSTATGSAQFILSADQKSLKYEELFTGLVATAAHIHQAPAGSNGDIVHPFPTIDKDGTHVQGVLTGTDATKPFTATDVTNLNTVPSIYYANAHSKAFTAGEIRGQIQKQ